MNKKLILSIIAFLASIFLLTGCSTGGSPESMPKVTTADVQDSQSVLSTLNKAQTIKIKKSVISFGDEWTVYADGVEVGTIKGKPIYMLGDTYSLFSTKGNLVGSEGEEYRVINHQAKVYDYNNQLTGMIDQQIFSWMLTLKIYDNTMKHVGSLDQNFSFAGLDADIKGANGAAQWHMHKAILSWGADLTIDRKSDDPTVTGLDAIWASVITNEIKESQSGQKNTSSKSRN